MSKPARLTPDPQKKSKLSHVLLGHRASSFPALDFERNFNHQKRYTRVQPCANAISTILFREYVPRLSESAKCSSPESLFELRELVRMNEDNSFRGDDR